MRQLLMSLMLLTFAKHSLGAESSKYFVFVGEKISVTVVPSKEGEIPFDNEYLAKYRVVEPYRGNYGGKEIEFTAFDHIGPPAFANYQHVLMYVELHEGEYFHAKYQYTPLYRTKDGRWAGTYDAHDYDHEYNKHTAIKPEVIDFLTPVVFDIARDERNSSEKRFPKPYYRIEGSKAVAVYGNYVPELFLLKQNGVLKARGDFQ